MLAYALHSENRDAEQDIRRTDAQMAGAVYSAADTIEQSVEQGSGIARRALDVAAKLVEALPSSCPPQLTRDQAELEERAAEERAEDRADLAAYFDNEDARARLLQSIRSDDAERERQQQREPDRDRGRELER